MSRGMNNAEHNLTVGRETAQPQLNASPISLVDNQALRYEFSHLLYKCNKLLGRPRRRREGMNLN